MHEKTLTSYDGTRIAYLVAGRGERWLVIANGYGGTFCAWTEIIRLLEDRYRFLIWDYRGMHRSQIPADRDHLRIEDNCRDLDLLMQAERIERVILAGWSVGVQVALEQYRRRPETIEALLLINGAHGRVLHRSLDGKLAGLLLPPYLTAMRHLSPAVAPLLLPLLRSVARSPLAVTALARAGLITGSPASLPEALQSVLRLDFGIYIQMALLADQHDTEDLLPFVRVPSLVTAGERDIITSPRLARHVASRIPGAEYFEIPRGTHYAVMEFPRLLANRIDSFLRSRIDFPPEGSARS
jgi:pimeloyl-ACP methyl ester carboxylesterase